MYADRCDLCALFVIDAHAVLHNHESLRKEIPHEGAFGDLVWSDPEDIEAWAVSSPDCHQMAAVQLDVTGR